jgi:hypothetical protein
MNFRFPAFIGIISQLFIISLSRAQSPDSVLYISSSANLHRLYLDEIGDNAQIYHGSEFIRNGMKVTGFPFYKSDSLFKGTVSYQGTIYPDQSLQYDLVAGELITNNYPHSSFIVLSTDKVDSFTIDDHVFVKLKTEKSNGLPSSGFYDQLISDEPGLYVNRYKKFVPATGSIDPKYTAYDDYYVRMKNVYYPVDGKNALLELFRDHKDDLKKYIRTNKIKFNKNKESSLVLTTIYYSRLKRINE